tara:strand:- start:198 stop:1583 length:1386 start_codon:yes stop_codon:yes gene_type:complete
MKSAMKFTANEKIFNLKLIQDGSVFVFDFTCPFRNKKVGFAKKPFDFILSYDNEEFVGSGAFGQDALWLPISDESGIKIIRAKDNADQILKNIEYIKSINCDLFPKIDWFCKASIGNVDCVFVQMENIQESNKNNEDISYLNYKDREYIDKIISTPMTTIQKCVQAFVEHELMPEDTWYKNGGFGTKNLINGKLVDFHMFEHAPGRYKMPANNTSHEICENIYQAALKRYKNWAIQRNERLPKWKGKIYQGMKFDNDYTMPGYTSDGTYFDSYTKLNFLPLDKIKGGKVLDLGSNQGFFSMQCALHGAGEVTGIELTTEDVLLANEIKNNIIKLDNVNFINTDLIEYLNQDTNWYELIIMSSVLHQTHPDLYKCDDFLQLIGSKCRRFFFETPIRHKHYMYSVQQIDEKLKQHYHSVRLAYIYDAYSTGARAVFLCHPLDPGYNKEGEYMKWVKEGRVGKR